MQTTESPWQAAADAIEAARKILAVSHIAPDGDAVGSLLGISETMRALGKDVTAVIDDGVPPALQFVPQSATILPGIDAGEFDLMITVDSSDLERIGVAGAYGMAHSKEIINLDHHPTNTRYGNINLVVSHAVAAAEIVFDLVNYIRCQLTEAAAYALLTGLVTDTQGFRISATNDRTLEIARALMQFGAPLSQIMAQTLNRRPYQEVVLWKLVFPSVAISDGLIHAAITRDNITQAGLDAMTDGGLVSHLVNVDQAKVSIVFKELSDLQVEVGFRSKPGYDVASLAVQLGGGGHTQASGCTMDGTLAQVRSTVLPLAHQIISARDSELV
ncbi:MAG: bifunctional oligoribonuclease/PAP phosphatase NrnA [Chloroflexi bacterium]|nr:bifunctional oligoribonuclease/PAP phosphatase NrnA [Chloroflexota bacterium]